MSEEITQTAEEGSQEPRAFSQEDVNRIVADRVAREAKKYEGFAEYKAKAERLDEIEEQNKSELEKANERAAKAESELAAFHAERDRRAWAAEVSADTGVPVDIIKGSTKEEMAEHAASLARYFKKPAASVVQSEGFAPAPGAGASTAQIFANSLDGIL